MEKRLHTKFGTAVLNQRGYYAITSEEKGNYGKTLHRLMFESFYGEIPKGYVIHHKNGNKQDNCILNLQLMEEREHLRQHNIGRKLSEETRRKLSAVKMGHEVSEETRRKITLIKSKNNNTTGFFRVVKSKDKRMKQGFTWKYQFIRNGKNYQVFSSNLLKLKEKVIEKGYEWFVVNINNAKNTCDEYEYHYEELC